MKFVLKFYLLFFGVAFLEGAKFRCDYSYKETGWFKHHVIPAIWPDARLRCKLEGGILASPTTKEIKNLMIDGIRNYNLHTGIHAFSPGNYYTVDGIPLDDIPHEWLFKDPDNANNAARCLAFNKDGKLFDGRCEVPRPYMCFVRDSQKNVTECGTTDPEYHFEKKTNKCYKFHDINRNYSRAHFACSAEGGHLAIINSETESRVLANLFNSHPHNSFASIGFHNWDEGADWTTVQGQTIREAGFATFGYSETNNMKTKSCGAVSSAGLLLAVGCEYDLPFICEKKPDYPRLCDPKKV